MEKEVYQNMLKELHKEYESKKYALSKEYAIANNPYDIGDKVTDHMGTILIDKISFSVSFQTDLPCAIYEGVELNKNGTPNKKGKRRKVWQSNVGK